MTNRCRSLAALAVLIACPLVAFAAGAKKAPPSPPVATIGGQKITEEELNAAVGTKLFRIRSEEYTIRRNVLDDLITERLLQAEAARRGMSYETFMKTEVEGKATVSSNTDLDSFYEAMKDRFPGLSKEQAIAQITDNMKRAAVVKRMAELVDGLRTANDVKVLLDPPRAPVAATGPSRGKDDAPVTIVEFSDYECPFCGRSVDTIKRLEASYGDKVRIVHRDFPLPSHRGAPKAAEAAHCAEDQGRFWQMHEKLFAKGGSIGDPDILKAAQDAELDLKAFQLCMNSGKHTATWKAAKEEGTKIGVQSTPTFFINGRMLLGAVNYDQFAKIVDEELKK